MEIEGALQVKKKKKEENNKKGFLEILERYLKGRNHKGTPLISNGTRNRECMDCLLNFPPKSQAWADKTSFGPVSA